MQYKKRGKTVCLSLILKDFLKEYLKEYILYKDAIKIYFCKNNILLNI